MKKYILLMSILVPVLCQAQYKKTAAVLNLKAGPGVSEMLINLINEYFGTTVGNMTEFQVVSGQALVSRLKLKKENSDQLLACGKPACVTEIGEALGVQKVICGNIRKEGNAFIVTLELVDVQDKTLHITLTEKYGGDETLLGEQFDGYVESLLKLEAAERERRKAKAAERKELMGKLVSAGDTQGTGVSAAAGGVLLVNKGILFGDYIRLGGQRNRHRLTLEVQLKDVVLEEREIPDSLRVNERIKYTGLTFTYGYELVKFLNGWVTVLPGLTGGYLMYDYSNITEEYSPTDLDFIVTERDTATNQSYLGGQVSVEVGNWVTARIRPCAYLQAKVFYLGANPIIAQLDFGIRVTYKL